MQRTDLEIPALTALSLAARRSSCTRSMCFPAVLITASAIFGAAQCSAQDVAEAARHERTQKQSKQKKSKHIYTERDLKRAQILTPEDRAQVEAKKNQTVPSPAEKSGDAVDAQSLSPDAPLGDVARRFRKQKESQKLQNSAEFHLPFANSPALASPKPPVIPLRPRLSNPVAPRLAPVRPPVRRSPFERPRTFVPAPRRIAPSRPPAVPAALNGTAKLSAVIVKPGDSLWKIAQQNLGKAVSWRDLLAANPGIVDGNRIAAGSQIYVPTPPLRTATKFTVRKGDTLTKIAQTQLGHASFWSCIGQANPGIHDANLIFEGQQLLLPATCKP